jgi:hypothetical protein
MEKDYGVGYSVFSAKAETEFKNAALKIGRQLYVKTMPQRTLIMIRYF